MVLLIVFFVSVGLLLVMLAIPLIRRRIAPNDWYGVRVVATFADDWVWYEANASSGRDLFILGTVQIAIALLLPLLGRSELTYAIANIVVLLAGTVTFAIVASRRANRLLRERQRDAA